MKIMKLTTFLTLIIVSLSVFFLACSNGANTTTNNSANNSTANTDNNSNTEVVVNSNQTPANNTAPVSNATPAEADDSEADIVDGQLQVGKTESVILYVGEESGDYAGYCFTNDSEAGRAILAKCKDKEKCEVTGTVDHESECKVPGLEADLSDSGKITKVKSAKSLGSKK